MHSISTWVAPLLLASSILPILTSATTYGACVNSCISTDPVSSACDGSETGTALAQCTCASFPPGNLLITCIQTCPQDQQLVFAEGLPSLCAQNLFPNLDLSSASSSAGGSAATSASGSGETATGTGSKTGSATGGTATATKSSSGTGSAASTSPSSGAAVALGAGTGAMGYLAYAAVAAFL